MKDIITGSHKLYKLSTQRVSRIILDHVLPVREVRLSSGAEFIVVVCGEIMTMPGLPKIPAAENINVDDKGLIQGLF